MKLYFVISTLNLFLFQLINNHTYSASPLPASPYRSQSSRSILDAEDERAKRVLQRSTERGKQTHSWQSLFGAVYGKGKIEDEFVLTLSLQCFENMT